jgi:hypothetical protein
MAITIAAVCMVPCAASAVGPADAVDVEDERHRARADQRMAEGDEHQAAGAHAEAARAYAKAFDAFAERSTSDAKEKQAVSLAVDEFRLAQQADPESLALLEEEAALLERFEAHPKHQGALPEGMSEELARLRARIEELRRQQQRRDAEAAREPAVSSARLHRDVAILGSGVVGIVGGVALLGVGAWTFGEVRERREERLAAFEADEYPDEDGLRAALDQWHQRGRGIATGLVVGGAVLTGVGIGLTSWGAARLWRTRRAAKRRASVTVPMISLDRVGLVTTVRF